MTVAPIGGGKALAPWADLGDDLDDGLQDVGGSDLSIPRLQIMHKHATFKDSTTGVEFDTLNAIFLGVVKQRIMWDSDVDEGDKPQCKSSDYNIGFPQMRTDIDTSKQFPWDRSNFDKASVTVNEHGQIELPCDVCAFNQWTKNGSKSVKPPCSEQWTMPLFYFLEDEGNEVPHPAIISFQRSGAKPAKTYAASFKAARQPMFTVMTTVTLTAESRGSVDFCTPNFKRGASTDSELWRDHADMYRGIREMLHTPPRPAEAVNETAANRAAAAPAASAPAAAASKTPAAPPAPRRPPSAAAATALPADDPWETAAPAAPSAGAPTEDPDDLPF